MDSPIQSPEPGARVTWSTRDIVVAAALAVAVGLAFIVYDWIYILIRGVLGPITQSLAEGFWLLGALLVPYIVRRPGSALIGEVIAAIVEASFNPFGIGVILAGVLEGLGAEVVFLLTGYRRFGWGVMALAGAFDAFVFFWTYVVWTNGYLVLAGGLPAFRLMPWVVIGFLALEVLSGAAAGWLARAVGDALVPTGVFDGFAIAAQRRQGR
ncbi:MAG TPA: ECF transporter S component [Chloroflexota bacterium]|nr:ECF transporter S component [Chloroflexota bacterium]